jgi:hypothetical protein
VKRSLLLALVALTLLAACGEGQAGSEGPLGKIRGSVLLTPTCPVETTESPCPERPLAGISVRVVDDEGEVHASAVSDDDGRFEMDVTPGTYLLTASIEQDPARSVRPTRVEVGAGELVQTDVLVDSGIR